MFVVVVVNRAQSSVSRHVETVLTVAATVQDLMLGLDTIPTTNVVNNLLQVPAVSPGMRFSIDDTNHTPTVYRVMKPRCCTPCHPPPPPTTSLQVLCTSTSVRAIDAVANTLKVYQDRYPCHVVSNGWYPTDWQQVEAVVAATQAIIALPSEELPRQPAECVTGVQHAWGGRKRLGRSTSVRKMTVRPLYVAVFARVVTRDVVGCSRACSWFAGVLGASCVGDDSVSCSVKDAKSKYPLVRVRASGSLGSLRD